MSDFGNNIATCYACPKRQKPGVVCTVDGKNMGIHAEAHDCPESRFPARGLGDTFDKLTTWSGVKRVMKAVTGDAECGGCGKRKEALNALVPYSKGSE